MKFDLTPLIRSPRLYGQPFMVTRFTLWNLTGAVQGLTECINFRSVSIAKQKGKDEQDQENPNDFRDPSVEEKERLLAVDKDEEEEGFVKDKGTDTKNPASGAETFRRLICVDEASKVFYAAML